MRFVITDHLRERFCQRSRYNCSDASLGQFITDNKDEIDRTILERLDLAQESKFLLNDSNFMEKCYLKYGYDHIPHFLVHQDLIFIMLQERGRKVVVTCLLSKWHLAGRQHPKFKKVSF